jgi:integrase
MKFHLAAEQILQNLPIRPKTSQTYNSVYRQYIYPALHQYELDQIKREYIQSVIISLPPQTGATTLAVIKTIFREAIDNGYCENSPASTVRRPKIQVKPRKFIPLPELFKLEFPKFKTQINFLAMHGLRWGEAVALTESDIHGGRVHVTKSIHGELKSRAGMRAVPHVSEFKPFPKTPKALRKELSVYGAHIHSLRHTYAYLLKTSGVHVTTAQKLMGHADPGVTLGIYTRFRDEEIDNAGAAIMDSLRGKSDYLMFTSEIQ